MKELLGLTDQSGYLSGPFCVALKHKMSIKGSVQPIYMIRLGQTCEYD